MNLKRFFPFAIALASTFVAGVLFATLGTNLFNQGDRVGSDLRADTPTIVRGTDFPSQYSLEEAFISVTASIKPTVVQIIGRQTSTASANLQPYFDGQDIPDALPPEWRQFFERDNSQNRIPRTGLGSGVIIRSDGYIATNYHVIAESNMLQVMLHDGSIETALVVGSDEKSDLAVIKIDKDDLASVPFGIADDVRVGQWVLAFGSPLSAALDNTVTAGIVSALGRTSEQLNRMNLFSDFIQTDAAINRGNSGGALVNLKGELIGINTAILSPTGLNSGIGFAIPVDVVDNVVTQLIEKGRVDRGYLGIRFDGLSLALVDALGVPPGSAQITAVMPGSAAEAAGLTSGEIITSVNGITLTGHNELRILIGNMKPGDEVVLDISDGEETRSVTVELGLLDPKLFGASDAEEETRDAPDNLQELGLTLRTLDAEEFARQVDLEIVPEFDGVIIEDINPSSLAYIESDLRQSDIIVEFNREPVSSLREFQRVYNRLEKGASVVVKVKRLVPVTEGERGFVAVLTALTKPD